MTHATVERTAVHPRRRLILGALCISLLMVAMDSTILHTATPDLVTDLRPTSVQQMWIINAYALVLAGLLVTMGGVGDRTGRKRLLGCGLLVFTAASLLAAAAPGPRTLVVARALLGLGGAMIMPSTLSLLRQVFTDARERARAIAIWGGVASLGAAAGPVLGGALVHGFGWRAAFLANVPLALAAFALIVRLVPESRVPSVSRLDRPGVALSCLGMVAVVQGIKMVAQTGFLRLASGGFLLAGLALLALFVRRQLTADDPLIDVRLLALRQVAVGITAYTLAMSAMAAMLYLTSQWLQFTQGLTALAAGVHLLPCMAASGLTVLAVPRLLRRLPARMVLGAGLALMGAPLILPAVTGSRSPLFIAMCLTALGAGASLALATVTTLVMSAAPAERAGSAAAIQQTSYELGNVLGIAVIGSLTTALYAARLATPEGVPDRAAHAARDSIGEAVSNHLPGPTHHALAEAASTAFTSAFTTAAAITGTALLLAAALASIPVRHRMNG